MLKEINYVKFKNPEEWIAWGEIEHPHYGMVMTYYPKGSHCFNTYSQPILHEDINEIEILNFDQDEYCWEHDGSIWYELTEEEIKQIKINGL